MPKLKRQVGFCLICGNSVYNDQVFFETEEGLCHGDCLDGTSSVKA